MHALEFSTTDKIDANSQFIEFKPLLSVIDFFPYLFYNFYIGTDATQVEMSSCKIGKIFSVCLIYLGKVSFESSGLATSCALFEKF